MPAIALADFRMSPALDPAVGAVDTPRPREASGRSPQRRRSSRCGSPAGSVDGGRDVVSSREVVVQGAYLTVRVVRWQARRRPHSYAGVDLPPGRSALGGSPPSRVPAPRVGAGLSQSGWPGSQYARCVVEREGGDGRSPGSRVTWRCLDSCGGGQAGRTGASRAVLLAPPASPVSSPERRRSAGRRRKSHGHLRLHDREVVLRGA